MRFTIGLATTVHDPAIAILGPDGEVLFAEASERYLQFKRAPGCEPDLITRMLELAREWLNPDASVVIATSWGLRFTEYLERPRPAILQSINWPIRHTRSTDRWCRRSMKTH
jgi:carbamoyltransferase